MFQGLTTESYWADFAKGVTGAIATGGPAYEILENSYKEKHNTSFPLGSRFDITDTLYVVSNSYWTSTYGDSSSSANPILKYVAKNGCINNGSTKYTYQGIRPTVCLPSDVLGTVGTSVTINHTLTVNPNGGTWNSTTNNSTFDLVKGETKAIANPTRTGYTFGGWTVSGTGSSVSGTTFTMGTENTTLTAKWTANTYTVAYNGNGSTGGSTASSTHTYNVAKALTANGFTRSYAVTFNHNYTGSTNTSKTATYTFKNWNTVAGGTGTSYANSASVTNLATSGTFNLYAQWTSASVSYTPTRTGYTFGGWFTDAACTGTRVDTNGTYTPTAATTLYAKWTANTYTVAYNGNGSTGGSTASSTHTYDVAKALTANGFTRSYAVTFNHNYTGSTNTSKTATYTFKNWNTVAGGTGTSYANSASVTNLATSGTFNLYAQWTSASVSYTPTRTGYTFGGWFTDAACTGTRVDTNGTYTPTAATTLYAKWTANTYTVAYNGNGSTGGSTASSTHTYDVAKALTANGFTRSYAVTFNHNYTGSTNTSKTATYTFKNWNTVAGGTGTSYANSASVTNLATSGTFNLYAQWTSASVSYTPTRTGYTFGGWFTDAACTGTRVDTNGTYTPTAATTLYAKWTANTYTVAYNGNGSTGGSTASSTHTYDVAKALTANGFTRSYAVTFNHNYTGSTNTSKTATYTFKNWNTVAGGTGTSYANSASVTNLATSGTFNLYAQWDSHSVTYNPEREGYTFAGCIQM